MGYGSQLMFYKKLNRTMKKKLFVAMVAMATLPCVAQTDFRHITYEEAVAAAKAENKMLFLDFYTDWCGPCKMMINNVFPQKVVGDYFNAKFVCLKVNAEKEGKELAKKHVIEAYPTFIVLDADEKVLGTKVGGNSDGVAFIEEIDRLVDPDKTPERLKHRYESGERTTDLISAYAALKMQEAKKQRKQEDREAKMKEAMDIVYDYFRNLSAADKLKAENLFIYTSYTESPLTETAKFMIANREQFDEDSKKTIAGKIDELYRLQMIGYLSGYQPYDEADYLAVKKGLAELDKLESYAMVCRFIECHAQGDLNAFLNLCQAEGKQLSEETFYSIIMNFSALFDKGDEAVKQRAAKYVRGLLPEMPVNNLFFIASQIGQLEGSMKGH